MFLAIGVNCYLNPSWTQVLADQVPQTLKSLNPQGSGCRLHFFERSPFLRLGPLSPQAENGVQGLIHWLEKSPGEPGFVFQGQSSKRQKVRRDRNPKAFVRTIFLVVFLQLLEL